MIITVVNLTGGRAQSTCAVNLACELAAIAYPFTDRWQSRYRVVLLNADPRSAVVAHYRAGMNLPVSCEQRRPAGLNVKQWIQRVKAIAAEVDYVVIVTPPHSEALTTALVGSSDLVVIPCLVSGSDLRAVTPITKMIRAARAARTDACPKCLLVPTSSGIGARNGDGIGAALRKLGEPLAPVLYERAEFESAYSEGRWIGDFAWNSPAHLDIAALATSVRHLFNAQEQ
jgi:cellulose biosynthesis protein BcsQ